MISIVIPVKDGGEALERCLRAISCQQLGREEAVELVVVDSGSRDGSVRLAREHGALVEQIAPREFSHGAARNLGASLSQGELLVFISQDATPADERWLARLSAPLRTDALLAGVYGRQVANEDATPPERYFLDFLYGPRPRLQRAGGLSELSMETTLFSNVNSAIRRELWERFPFVEDIVMSEDQDWSRRVLLDGWCIAYEPLAVVRIRTGTRSPRPSAASSTRAPRPIGLTWPAKATPSGCCERRRCATRGARSAGFCGPGRPAGSPMRSSTSSPNSPDSCSARGTSVSRNPSSAA